MINSVLPPVVQQTAPNIVGVGGCVSAIDCNGQTIWIADAHRDVIFGCADTIGGAAGSVMNLLQMSTLNHRCDVASGVLQDDCAAILQNFFRKRRDEQADRVKRFASRDGPED